MRADSGDTSAGWPPPAGKPDRLLRGRELECFGIANRIDQLWHDAPMERSVSARLITLLSETRGRGIVTAMPGAPWSKTPQMNEKFEMG
jgi:hypothetical protein